MKFYACEDKRLKLLFTSAALKHSPMGPQSEAYHFWNLHKITNKMVYNLFGHKFLHNFFFSAPDYISSDKCWFAGEMFWGLWAES